VFLDKLGLLNSRKSCTWSLRPMAVGTRVSRTLDAINMEKEEGRLGYGEKKHERKEGKGKEENDKKEKKRMRRPLTDSLLSSKL
jgi:hypothetical protein